MGLLSTTVRMKATPESFRGEHGRKGESRSIKGQRDGRGERRIFILGEMTVK